MEVGIYVVRRGALWRGLGTVSRIGKPPRDRNCLPYCLLAQREDVRCLEKIFRDAVRSGKRFPEPHWVLKEELRR